MNYTSIEQSKHLIELGLSHETADMCYMYTKFDGESEPQYFASLSKAKTNDIPCWSIGALLELIGSVVQSHSSFSLKISIEQDGTFGFRGYIMDDINHQLIHKFHSSSVINVGYNIVVWLRNNHYL